MKNSKAYDFPIRVFHWLFALLFVLSFTIGNFIDDDSMLFAYHMLSGILMVFLVLLRVFWGFVGSTTARFRSFLLRPSDLVDYFISLLTNTNKRHLGHNPASSYAAILMMFFTIGLGSTGLLMSLRIYKHFFEELHELLAHGFLIVVILHIVGVLLHQIRHSDGMAFSMINGRKACVDDEHELKSNHPIIATLLIIVTFSMGSYLLKNYNYSTGTLSVFSKQLKLGESDYKEDNGKYHEDDDD